jgi:hypothetical protein
MWPFTYDRVNPVTQNATTTTTKKKCGDVRKEVATDKGKGVKVRV